MSIFKHHDHDEAHESDAAESSEAADRVAAEEEQFEGTEDPVEREHDRTVANEVRNTSFQRPPGI